MRKDSTKLSEQTPLLPARHVTTNPSCSTASSSSTCERGLTLPQKTCSLDLATSHKFLILSGIFLATFLGALDATVTASLIQPVSADFNASQEASWLGSAFLLASLTFTPMYGRLSDILGRRTANSLAISVFTLGTFGCAVAPNMGMLIVARFVAGCGGGGMATTSAIICADLFDLKERVFVTGISSLVWSVGGGLGGPFGGYMNDLFGWRTAFMIQVPLLLVALLGGLLHINYQPSASSITHHQTSREKLSRIDFAGCTSLFLTFGCILLSLALHNNELIPWTDARVLIPTCLVPVFFSLFIYVESNCAKEPILPFELLQSRATVAPLLVIMLQAITNWTLLFHLPIYFIAVEGTTASAAGAHLLPTSAAAGLGGLLSGMIVHKTGRYWGLGVISTISGALSILTIVYLNPASPEWYKWLQITPFGAALSISITTSYAAIMASVPQSQIPTITGIIWLFRASGQIIGVGASSAVFQGLLLPALKKVLTFKGADQLIEVIRKDNSVLNTLEGDVQIAAREAFEKAVRGAFWLAFVASVLTVLSYASIPVISLDNKRAALDIEDDNSRGTEEERGRLLDGTE